jgi:hypothetical protein
MITKENKLALKKMLGNKYTPKVLEILNENKIFSKKGVPFSSGYIRHVLNGKNENFQIEEVLFEVFKSRNDFHTELDKKRKAILENKKPEAGTPGN